MAQRLTTAQVAQEVGIRPATWRAYVARGQAPEADGQLDARTPYWLRATIDKWIAQRPRK